MESARSHLAAAVWPAIANAEDIPSPALLLHRERMEANLAAMLQIAGGPQRLRPHLKTHKLAELVRRQVSLGITKGKCATLAEAELAAANGLQDILLALQPVGPQIQRLHQLTEAYPSVEFSTLIDCPSIAEALDHSWRGHNRLGVFLDLDIGQHRTGIVPGPAAMALARHAARLPGLRLRGLHAYDGHLGITDLGERTARCEAGFEPVSALAAALVSAGLPTPVIVAGGSPTFALHARRPDVELSPGTTVLWDAGYATKLPDLPFQPAAVLLTRVISRPGPDLLCLDLGHKAVAAEMPHPRAVFPKLPQAEVVSHSEEHLVLRTPEAAFYEVGDVLYALPWHVCPTVALHQEVWVVEGGRAIDCWQVTARARRLTI
jgi:D-serine deaminase-like pyridoxal phosphate-dependent protein